MGNDLAVGVRHQLDVLFGRQRRAAGVGHLYLAHFEGRDEAGCVGDDEVIYGVEEGTSLLEVVGVPGHLVEVAAPVFVQHEGTRAGVELDNVFSLVQVDALLHDVLGKNLGVIDGQELDEGPRGELKVELYGIWINGLQSTFWHGFDVIPGQSGPADGDVGVVVARESEYYVIGGYIRTVEPRRVLIKVERECQTAIGDVPTGAQVADDFAGVDGVVLH